MWWLYKYVALILGNNEEKIWPRSFNGKFLAITSSLYQILKKKQNWKWQKTVFIMTKHTYYHKFIHIFLT